MVTVQKNNLTRKQHHLIKELDELTILFGMDYHNINEYKDEAKTPCLEVMKNKLVRSQVIISYTLVDEFLSNIICRFYFGKERSFQQLWRTKRFRIFNHYIIDNLYPLQKLDQVCEIISIPKPIANNIRALNDLRNGLVHSFFPENRRKSKPIWKGHSIFSIDGATHFQKDMQIIWNFFTGIDLTK